VEEYVKPVLKIVVNFDRDYLLCVEETFTDYEIVAVDNYIDAKLFRNTLWIWEIY
jgi:hypothetical protein